MIFDILVPHLVRHIAARGHPIASTPELLTPIPFAKRRIFRQQLVLALPFEILHRPRHRHVRRYPYQHIHVVPIDRSGVDDHLMRPRNLPQQLPRPLPNISAQYRKPVLRDPHDVILAVSDRVTAGLRILHTRSVASRSPKGEGFTDPRGETLNMSPNRGITSPVHGGTRATPSQGTPAATTAGDCAHGLQFPLSPDIPDISAKGRILVVCASIERDALRLEPSALVGRKSVASMMPVQRGR